MQPQAAHSFLSTKRFVIERQLGQGGMGVVYQALDLERNARVALKALSQRDAINIYRLKNEFRQLADLSHPNLVTLHELCNEGGLWFFTMELVEGQSFDAYVTESRGGSDPPERWKAPTLAGRFMRDVSITLSQRAIGSEFPLPHVTANVKRLRHALRQLVEAVAALHDAGKLHRDLKPSNVLVTPEGRVVVLDFGLVSSSTLVEVEAQDAERSVGGCVFGTPAYMSPEQAAGDAISTASDWYAVGCMLYEALTGQLPFDGTVLEILRLKNEAEPVPPSDLVKGVPDDLDQLCRDLLHRDPTQRPSGSEILRYLTGHSVPPPVFDAQASAVIRKQGELFVGREQHLTELRDAFEVSRNRKPVTVFVHGLSGMGKSALVRCFANELIRSDEAVVLRGRCYERENVPYKAFDNIIDALSRYMMRLPAEQAAELLPRNVHSLALLFPVLKRVKAVAHARRSQKQTTDARELRNQAFAALKDLLLRITDYQPLVLNIDDLQWADMDSARLMAFLMGPPEPPPLLLVGTYRRDEADNSPFLQHIVGERSLREGSAEVRELAVDALGEDEARQLASALLRELGEAGGLLAETVAAEAEGVPFFIAELVHHLKTHSEQGHFALAAQPVSLDQVILERIAGMPEDAQRLLRVLSVAAGPLEQGVAIEAAALQTGDRSALLALRAARLIRTRGTRQTDRAETYHDRVRETVVRNLHPDVVRNIHAHIADAMEHHDVGDPERLVVHYSGAGDGGRAGETAMQAAHAAAAKLAFNRAADLFRKAIDLVPPDDATGRELHKHLGDALANAGRGAQAAEAYLQAAEGLEGAEARALQRMAAQQYLRSGRIEEGVALTKELLRGVGVAWPRSTAAVLGTLMWSKLSIAVRGLDTGLRNARDVPPFIVERVDVLGSVFRELSAIDALRGAALQRRYLSEVLRAGEPNRLLLGLAWEAFDAALIGGSRNEARTRALLARTEEVASTVGTPYAHATAQMARAGCEFFFARFADALAPASEALETFRNYCPGTSWEQNLLTTFRLGAIEQTGSLLEVAREAPDLARQALERDDHFSRGFLALAVPASRLMADDPSSALEILREQRDLATGEFTTLRLWGVHRTVDVHLYCGRGSDALAHHLSHWEAFQHSLLFRALPIRVLGHWFLARAALGAAQGGGDVLKALRVAREQATTLQHMGRTDAKAWSLIARAGIARIEGRKEHALQLLDEAVATCDRSQMPLFTLYARRNRGAMRGGLDGTREIDAVDAALRAQGVKHPERWVATYAPGFAHPTQDRS